MSFRRLAKQQTTHRCRPRYALFGAAEGCELLYVRRQYTNTHRADGGASRPSAHDDEKGIE